MYPYVTILGRTIGTYNIAAIVGGIAAFIYTAIRCKQTKTNYNDMIYYITFALGFLLIGAGLLYQITRIKDLIALLPYLFTDFKYFINHLNGGLVFYGGLFGAIVGCAVYSKVFRQDSRKMFMIATPAIPLFHAFGRIGCFLGGCCHGIENHKFGIAYTNSITGENGIPFLPVQLYESFAEFVIFAILVIYQSKQKDRLKYYKSLGLYFTIYGTLRFCLEFLRGDDIRGFMGFFSTSQWISLFVIPLGIYCLACPEEKNFLNKWFTSKKEPKVHQKVSA